LNKPTPAITASTKPAANAKMAREINAPKSYALKKVSKSIYWNNFFRECKGREG